MRTLTALALCLSLFAFGCPKERRAIDGARTAIEVVAQTVQAVDSSFAPLYREAAGTCLSENATRAGYDACVRNWNKTVDAVAGMKVSLLVLESSLDAWEAGSPNGQANLRDAAACFLESLTRLSSLLDVVGAKVPALTNAINIGSDLFGLDGVACPAGAKP